MTLVVQPEGTPIANLDDEGASFTRRTNRVAVVGMGYVGLPTALSLLCGGRDVVAVDVDAGRLRRILTAGNPKWGTRHVAALETVAPHGSELPSWRYLAKGVVGVAGPGCHIKQVSGDIREISG